MSFTRKSYYPWVVLLLCAAFLFYKYVLQVSPSIMTDQLMREFHVSGAGLGNLAATFFYAYFITQLFVGVILDKYSLRVICALAIAISGIGAIWFSYTGSLLSASIARGLMGFGAAFATVCYMKSAAVWFRPNQFAFIGGLLATAAMLGALFGEAPLAYIVQTQGWRGCLWLSGVLGLVIAVLFFLLVRNQSGQGDAVSVSEKYTVTFADVWSVLKNPRNWVLTFYSGLTFSPVAVFGGIWGNPFVHEVYHFSHTHVASLISLSFLGLAVGGPVWGWVSDRLNRRKMVMFWGNLVALVSLVPVIYVILPEWLLATLLFTFGFGVGAFMLGFAMANELNKLALSATVIALINTGDAIFGAFTEPLVGRFLDLGWHGQMSHGVYHFSIIDFKYAFILLPVYLLLAIGLLMFVRDQAVNSASH